MKNYFKRFPKRKKVVNETPKLEMELSQKDTLEVMMKGTGVSCKLVKILTDTGSGPVGVCTAFYGLAKASVFIDRLALLYGYDMQSFYQETRKFWEEYAETEEFQQSLQKIGFKNYKNEKV
jgi:hypothetical protein